MNPVLNAQWMLRLGGNLSLLQLPSSISSSALSRSWKEEEEERKKI